MKRVLAFAATLAIVCAALVVVGVLPAGTYRHQRAETVAYRVRLASLRSDNAQLKEDIRRLESDAEVTRLARLQFGMVQPGQEVYAIAGLRTGTDRLNPVVTTAPAPVSRHRPIGARLLDHLTFWN